MDNERDISTRIGIANQIVPLIQNTAQEANFAALHVDQWAEQLLTLLRQQDPRLAAGKELTGDIHCPELFTGAISFLLIALIQWCLKGNTKIESLAQLVISLSYHTSHQNPTLLEKFQVIQILKMFRECMIFTGLAVVGFSQLLTVKRYIFLRCFI